MLAFLRRSGVSARREADHLKALIRIRAMSFRHHDYYYYYYGGGSILLEVEAVPSIQLKGAFL